MGNYRFRFSDMMPNSWFYKLRDMGKTKIKPRTKKHHEIPHSGKKKPMPKTYDPEFPNLPNCSRKSYYIAREFAPNSNQTKLPDPPRKSSKQRIQRRMEKSPVTESSERRLPESRFGSCKCRMHSNSKSNSSSNDIVLELGNNSGIGSSGGVRLAPIKTLPEKLKKTDTDGVNSEERRSSVSSPGLRLRVNSPRIAIRRNHSSHGRKSVSTGRKSISESLAVIKLSSNPERDFKESMLEMIIQNNITKSKDLEELLVRYLSLNSDEYHDVIIKVFKRIWVELIALSNESK